MQFVKWARGGVPFGLAMPYPRKQGVIARVRARSGFSEREPGYGGVFGAKVLAV